MAEVGGDEVEAGEGTAGAVGVDVGVAGKACGSSRRATSFFTSGTGLLILCKRHIQRGTKS